MEPASKNRGRWLTTGQVARRLGWCRHTICRKCADGSIPSMRLGNGHWRIPGHWLNSLLDSANGTEGTKRTCASTPE